MRSRHRNRERRLIPLGDNFEEGDKLLGIGLWPTLLILVVCFLLCFLSLPLGLGLGALLLGGAWAKSQKNPRWLEEWSMSLTHYPLYDPGQPFGSWEARFRRWTRKFPWFRK